MLKIRLARHGRKKRPFYRIVLTEHLKPVHAGYQEVFGWFDPLAHKMEVDVDAIKGWISKGAKPSERVAKLLFRETKDDLFSQYFVERERKREVRNPSEEEAKPAPKEEKTEEVKEEKKEEVKVEEVKEEVKVEEVKEEVKVEEKVEEVKEEVKEEVVEDKKEEVKEEKAEDKKEEAAE